MQKRNDQKSGIFGSESTTQISENLLENNSTSAAASQESANAPVNSIAERYSCCRLAADCLVNLHNRVSAALKNQLRPLECLHCKIGPLYQEIDAPDVAPHHSSGLLRIHLQQQVPIYSAWPKAHIFSLLVAACVSAMQPMRKPGALLQSRVDLDWLGKPSQPMKYSALPSPSLQEIPSSFCVHPQSTQDPHAWMLPCSSDDRA